MKRYEFWRSVALLLALFCADGARAQVITQDPGTFCSTGARGPVACIRPQHMAYDICQHIAGASARHLLAPGFFARLLWQESRFDPNALSPAGAQGIAQFMPATAERRGLADSYDPAQAIEASAAYLGALQRRYGNAGLAAVACNGGEGRADGFLTGGGLARETVNYVQIITGLTAEDWRDAPPAAHDFRLSPDVPFLRACLDMARTRKVSALTGPPGRPRVAKWGAQIAFGPSKAAARAKFDRAARQCRTLRGQSVDILFVKSRVQGRPGYYMARVSDADRRTATDLCKAARAQGCPCAVYKNW